MTRATGAVRRLLARTPLRVALVAGLLVLVAVALTATGAAAAAALNGYLLARVDSQLQSVAHQQVEHVVRGFPLTAGAGDDPGRLPSAYYIEVNRADGSVVGDLSAPLQPHQKPPALPHLSLAQTQARAGHPFTVAPQGGGSRTWRAVVTPFPDGSGSMTVAVSLDDVHDTVGRLVRIDVLVSLVVLVLLGGLGYVVVRASLRPLGEVERTAAAIAAGDLAQRVPDRDPRTEVGRLGRALNAMLAQIEAAFGARAASEASARRSEERMRRFVADASHELRTPLTSIRGFSELYRQGAVADTDDLDRLMRRIEDEAKRMGLLVEDLLLLARLDQQRPLELQPVDLLTLAADAVDDARAVDPDRPVTLGPLPGADHRSDHRPDHRPDHRSDHRPDRWPPGPVVVLGDEARLRQIVGNLMSNALTHTPPGTPVAVRVGVTVDEGDGWAVLEVADEGPGLRPEQAERVFERFYRADPSRTRARGGTGLGLSIVAALTAAHGGRVELDTGPGEGTAFRVRLPLEDGREFGEEAGDVGEAADGGEVGDVGEEPAAMITVESGPRAGYGNAPQ